MYHIFAAERHRQDGAGQGKYQAARKAALDATADPPCLVELGVAILASIGRVDQQVHLARAGRLLDPFGAVDQVAAPRLEPKPIERRLAKRLGLITPAHAIIEAYAVLTRLPAPHRLAPADAWTLINANFVQGRSVAALPAAGQAALLQRLAAAAIGGGRTYDALIAATAAHAGADELLTFNPRHFEASPKGLVITGL